MAYDDGNRRPNRYDLPAYCGATNTAYWVEDVPYFYGSLIKYVWRGWNSVSDLTKAIDCAERVWKGGFVSPLESVVMRLRTANMREDVIRMNDNQYSSFMHRQALAILADGDLSFIPALIVLLRRRKDDLGMKGLQTYNDVSE